MTGPAIRATAPLRISLAGGGSDLPEYYRGRGGHVLAAAVDQHVTVLVADDPRGGLVVDDETTQEYPDRHAMPFSLTRAALQRFGVERGLRLQVSSDCLAGTGLGWSGALTVALVAALARRAGNDLDASDAARQAYGIERDDLGRRVGWQDQLAAAYGGVVRQRCGPDDQVQVTRVPHLEAALRELLDRAILLFRTPMRRQSASILEHQARGMSPAGSRPQGATGEAEATGSTGATEAQRAIFGLVADVEAALGERDADRLGHLMHRHWTLKRTMSPRATTPAIDAWYDVARAAGAVGGKIVGAGGGGHLLLVCPPSSADEVTATLAEQGLDRVACRLDAYGVRTQEVA